MVHFIYFFDFASITFDYFYYICSNFTVIHFG